MALKQIKNKIIATKKTGQVTKAMESVSAVKMRKSQERAFMGRPYVHSALRILSKITQSTRGLKHPLLTSHKEGEVLVVIVTSDKGLAGSLNSAVLKRTEKIFREHDKVSVIAVGKKALEFSLREKKTVVASYTNVKDDVTLSDVYDIAKKVTNSYLSKECRLVKVVYQNFISTFEQESVSRTVLPLDNDEIKQIMSGIRPRIGKFSNDDVKSDSVISYNIEPEPEAVLETLLPQLVQILIYHSLLENKASEHSARMVAMKNATDKSKELVKSLTIKFNKARQAAITSEVSEITAGVEAMK
jgi:F-type H+-transporting ATPase subunit gamma